jgi:hypothetical protein
MFVRFRETARRLQASLVATRRSGGRICHEHVAGLGSVPRLPAPADRIAFWTKLHQRLNALSNRVDATQRGAILTAIHARIPMPTLDEHQAMQLGRAQADARFWQTLAEMHADDLEGHKGLLASTQRAIAEREPQATDTAEKAQAAKERLARVEKGESVAGIAPPLTRKDLLKFSGMTEAEARHCERVAEIAGAGSDWLQLMRDEQERRKERAEKAVVRKLHRLLVPE